MEPGLEQLVLATKEHSKKSPLDLNIKKTKILDSDKCQTKTKIKVDDEEIENVSHFEYLGASFHGDGRSTYEIRRRLAIARQKLKHMEKLWKGQNTQTKMMILGSCIFPYLIWM